MISVKVPGLKSWFDPKSVPFLSYQLTEKLKKRMQGRKGLFITLTYRHDDYESPEELYDLMKDRQDVPLFIRRLSRYLGISLRGKWMRKMEFQQGGWIHFHLVLDYPRTIPHSDLQQLWGYGHVWVERWTEHLSNYLAKYVGKGETVPGWILALKPKTVKIVAVSPGFWQEENPDRKKYEKKPPNPWGKSGCYIPIIVRLEQYRNTTLCRQGTTLPKYFTVGVHIGFLLQACMQHNIAIRSGEEGWLNLDIDRDDFDLLSIAAADAPAVHLINRSKPDSWPQWIQVIMADSLDERVYREAT